MSQLGQTRHFDRAPLTSGLPRSTDVVRPIRLVRFMPKPDVALFDHLVGEQLHLIGNGQSEGLGSFQIYHEFKFGRLLNR
jgi:hypothetical protein